MSKPKPKFVLFAHNATYDKLHQVATLGLTAAAMGKDVIVVLLFWTIIKVLGNIENSFNDIWSVKQDRSLARAL